MRNLTLLILCLFGMSCGDDTPDVDFRDVAVVTGLDFFDENGAAIGRWNMPNHKTLNVAVYPIPATSRINVSTPALAGSTLKTIWVVPAQCTVDLTENITELSQSVTYDQEEVFALSVDMIAGPLDPTIQLNLEGLSIGFYRLFYEDLNGVIGCTNFYCDPTKTNFPDLNIFDTLCEG